VGEVEEPFESFLENAKAKAKYYPQSTKMLTFSDDSGLKVRALNGFPGVHTHEFVAESGGLKNASNHLEALLLEEKDHFAQFTCVSILYDPFRDIYYKGEGTVDGNIHFPA
jgi:XTP/dITP diphosphohydrolase